MRVERWTKENKPLRIMRVETVPISKLKLHEAVIKEELDNFCKSLKSKGIFFRPILVDRKTFVVLDGHHRVEGLKRLGAKMVPAIFIDYFDDEVGLYTWFPIIWHKKEDVIRLLSSIATIDYRPLEEAKALVDKKEAELCIISSGDADAAVVKGDTEEILSELSKHFTFEYVDTLDFVKHILPDKGVLLYRHVPTKEEVIALAESGGVFPPKTTRHHLPYRYQDIRVRLSTLY